MSVQYVTGIARFFGSMCLVGTAFFANFSNVALALDLKADMTMVYEYRYSTDSGYTDANECVRVAFDANGVKVAEELVHDFISKPYEKNTLCAGVARGGSSNRYRIHLDNEGDFRCQEILSGVLPFVKFTAARDQFCAL